MESPYKRGESCAEEGKPPEYESEGKKSEDYVYPDKDNSAEEDFSLVLSKLPERQTNIQSMESTDKSGT